MSSSSGSPARRCRRVLSTALAGAAALAAAVSLPAPTEAHSFLSMPVPMSRMHGCRMGTSTLSGNGPQAGRLGRCPGPCPNSDFRPDTSPGNPAAVYRRGGRYQVRWTRNNHEGGFTRWALVPINQMNNKAAHQKFAFHWSCWNINRFTCSRMDHQRDCQYDRNNKAFKDHIRIPANLPNGDYVLGWSWYGGGRTGGRAHFGDYFDCSYVRVEGGKPLQEKHIPTFAGRGCHATVNRPGVCKSEPCRPLRKVTFKRPAEFDGRTPPPIYASSFGAPSDNFKFDVSAISQSVFTEPKVRVSPKVRVTGLRVANIRNRVARYDITFKRTVLVGSKVGVTLVAQTSGHVKKIEWFVNGLKVFTDRKAPFTIAGDRGWQYYKWEHPLFERRLRVTAKATGYSGFRNWLSREVVFVRAHNDYYLGNWTPKADK